MAALPYMQLYVADYLADTMHLEAEQHGAYLLLIMNYWQTGKPIPKTRLQAIARVSNDRWIFVEALLAEYFNDTGTHWQHARIDADLQMVEEAQVQRSKAGKASAESRKRQRQAKIKRESNDRSTTVEIPLNENSTNKETETETETETDTPPPPVGDDGLVVEEIVITLPAKGGTTHEIGSRQFERYRENYPTLDVMAQLKAIRQHLEDNPHKRMPEWNCKTFISSWMNNRIGDAGKKSQKLNTHGDFTSDRYAIDETARRFKIAGESA